MFCPSCNQYLLENQLHKTNLKRYMNTDIEYDAHCPLCDTHIGRMFWGKLETLPHLAGKAAGQAEAQKADSPGEKALAQPQPEPEDETPYVELLEVVEFAQKAPVPERGASSKYAQRPPFPPPSYYICPHCGERLPEDLEEIPFRTDDLA